MNKAQKFLLDYGIGDKIINLNESNQKNTPENAKKWIYLSDALMEYREKEIRKLKLNRIINR